MWRVHARQRAGEGTDPPGPRCPDAAALFAAATRRERPSPETRRRFRRDQRFPPGTFLDFPAHADVARSIFDRPALLKRLAGRKQDAIARSWRMTCSMLEGEQGHQRKELRRLIDWLRTHEKPDAIWLSTMLLTGFARQLKKHLGVPVMASLQGGTNSSTACRNRGICGRGKIIEPVDVDFFIAPSRFYVTLMCSRMRLRPEQVRLIPNGISTEGYGEPAASPNPPVIGYLARMRGGRFRFRR